VGRDGELAELTAQLSSPRVRLVTLTGPGGSGKTRLAVGVTQELVQYFSDGVYFVSLATVTASEVMWTSIAEVLDVPPEGRVPPAFFEHVAHRNLLLVLDNLEQIADADSVVSDLLEHGTQVAVIATSRKPLAVAGEHVHPVPPLELPEQASMDRAEQSGSVQLFVQHARMVKPSFQLSADNADAVVQVCRRLDGLPLAIELAAARIRLLSPAALLSRLDKILDIAAMGKQRPDRQKTLRDTIGWSCALLKPAPQALFYDLGVFAGGADLDAISAVSADALNGDDLLEVLADLVDVSLVMMGETADGEPRVRLLETIRAYAWQQLVITGQLSSVQERHAFHYLKLAQSWKPQLDSDQYVQARGRFEVEHDNFREALRWALGSNQAGGLDVRPLKTQLGLELCAALSQFWFESGYFLEMRRWLEQATNLAAGSEPSEGLAECLFWQGRALDMLGDLQAAHRCATASVAVRRRIGDASGMVLSLTLLADVESSRGQATTARALFEEALTLARDLEDPERIQVVLMVFAVFELSHHNYQSSLDLNAEALTVARQLGRPEITLTAQENLACSLRRMGRLQEAQTQMSAIMSSVRQRDSPGALMTFAEDYAAILADLGGHHAAVRLLGAAEALRARFSVPRMSVQQEELNEPMAKCRAALSAEEWAHAYQTGRNMTVEDALNEAHAVTGQVSGR
jgi:predicted ATPase